MELTAKGNKNYIHTVCSHIRRNWSERGERFDKMLYKHTHTNLVTFAYGIVLLYEGIMHGMFFVSCVALTNRHMAVYFLHFVPSNYILTLNCDSYVGSSRPQPITGLTFIRSTSILCYISPGQGGGGSTSLYCDEWVRGEEYTAIVSPCDHVWWGNSHHGAGDVELTAKGNKNYIHTVCSHIRRNWSER